MLLLIHGSLNICIAFEAGEVLGARGANSIGRVFRVLLSVVGQACLGYRTGIYEAGGVFWWTWGGAVESECALFKFGVSG